MRLLFLCLMFVCCSHMACTQDLTTDGFANPRPSDDTSTVYLTLNNANFFKNNEFFNAFVEGYTLTGYFFQPGISYRISDQTILRGGLHLLKYSGESGFHQIQPVFSLQHRIYKGIDLIMGTIRGECHHGLIDPLYHEERYLRENVENGLQFLIDKPFIRADLWVNWKNFITRNAEAQEKFEIGFSSEVPIYRANRTLSVVMPLQLIGEHKGGQINRSDEPVSTLANFAVGPDIKVNVNSRLLSSLSWKNMYVGFQDLSPGSQKKNQEGHALMSTFSVNTQTVNMQLAWWKAHEFITSAGNPLYQVYSRKMNRYLDTERALITGRLLYHKNYKDLQFRVNVDAYWDTNAVQLDYGFGIYLLMHLDFFLSAWG